MARYKVTKEQLEMVVESFVMENSKKENKTQLDEGVLGGLDFGLGDFVKSLKKAITKIKPEIAKMAKEDPEVMADLKSAAKDMGKEDVAELEVDVNELYEAIFGEDKRVIQEGLAKDIFSWIVSALGLGGLVTSIPGFMSQIMGYSDWTWTSKLHQMLQPYCDALPPKMCGPLFLLAIGISIVTLVMGSKMRFNNRG
jgi:hypothetical protein